VILIVDDEPVLLDLLQRVLLEEGYHVLSAHDGEDALEISREYPGTIQAVLTDLSMPKLDGLELKSRISAERPGIKVLLMSGYVFSLPDGARLMSKPLDLVAVKQQIRNLLGPAPLKRRHAGG
jgi:two-component system cell cycle sensor histidine kinase/response regulator CckA